MRLGVRGKSNSSGYSPDQEWYDLHSHFLPGVDDGCRTVEETIALLEYSRSKGVVGMIATPHYYPEESIDSFLARRQKAAEKLQEVVESGEHQVPAICLGAEVAYYDGIATAEGLERLCLGKSSYMLLELPFDQWNSTVLRDVHTLSNVYGFTLILAHLERYLDIQSRDMLEEVCDNDVLIQMNAEFILDRWTQREALKRIRNGYVQVLGSDSHNMRHRMPNLREAVHVLEKKGLAEELQERNREVFLEAVGDE